MKKNQKFNLVDKLYLGSIGLMIFSIFMPWITFPIIGSFNALKHWSGVLILFILIGVGSLYFIKNKYSVISYLILSMSFITYLTYKIIEIGIANFSLDLGIMGKIYLSDLGFMGGISIFTFLGVGVYIFLIGFIGGIIFSINKLLKSN